jgi:regulator of sigma E protease
MALALMNLLPIPALDGGHAVFLLIEMIKGKPLSDKFMERAQLVGFVILMTLIAFVFGNDIFKYILK